MSYPFHAKNRKNDETSYLRDRLSYQKDGMTYLRDGLMRLFDGFVNGKDRLAGFLKQKKRLLLSE